MSLTDALLLEAYRDPKDIWIALRTDGAGQRGTGTENDPWDGGIRIDLKINLAGLDQDEEDDTRAVATTGAAHGFVEGDMVTVEGATGSGSEFYNGTFVIHSVQATSFKYEMQGDPGGAAQGTGISAARVVHQLDEVLRDLANQNMESISVHIGPGTYETRGGVQVIVGSEVSRSVGWRPRTGWKISGSGIGVTVLKVVGAARTDWLHNAVGGQDYQDRADYAEVSDLTTDSNMAGNPGTAVGAVALIGSHTRIRRVRATNFGTETSLVECFVLVVSGAHPNLHETTGEIRDCVIEDCVAELPWPNNVRETTILHVSSGERTSDGVMAFPRACAIRNCYVNCDYPGGKSSLRIAVASLVQVSGRQFELTTKTPHQRTVENNIVLNNVAVDLNTNNVFNGAFAIDSLDSLEPDTKLRFTLPADPPSGTPDADDAFIGVQFHALSGGGVSFVAEGNRIYNCPQGGPYHDAWSRRDSVIRNNAYSNVETGPFENLNTVSTTNAAIVIESITKDSTDPKLAHVDTSPIHHGFSAGDAVRIVNTSSTAPSDPMDANRHYYGRFEVLNPNATTFDYEMEEEPDLDELPVANHAPGYFTSDEEVAPIAGPQRLIQQSGNPPVALSYALENGQHIATAKTTYEKHGLIPGDAVYISKASRSLYNGFFTVVQVPDAKTFKYELTGDPGGTSTSGYFGRLWQSGRIVIENNLIELAQSITYFGPPTGILMYNGSHVSPYVYRQLIIRRNVIRLAKARVEPTKKGISKGIDILSCENAVVENNVIDLDDPDPIWFRSTGTARLFNNKTASGKLIEGLDPSTGRKFRDRVHDLVNDALLLAT